MSIYRATQKVVSEVANNRVTSSTQELASALLAYHEAAMVAADASRQIKALCRDLEKSKDFSTKAL